MPHHARGYRARFPFGTAADPAGGEVVTRTARYGAQRAGGDRGLSRACPFGFTLVSRDSNQYSLRRCAIHRHVRGAYPPREPPMAAALIHAMARPSGANVQ